MADLHVAIVGGGLGGLSLAFALKKCAGDKKLTVDVYESKDKLAELGAGVSAWERTRSIFREWGIADILKNRAQALDLNMRKSDTKQGFSFNDIAVPHGQTGLPRSDLLTMLEEQLELGTTPGLTVHLSKRLTSYEQDADGVTLHFADGSHARANVLVGADGVGSPTRRSMYADLIARETDPERKALMERTAAPCWTGTYVYRALIDREALRKKSPKSKMVDESHIWCGKGGHAVTYPISPAVVNLLYFESLPNGIGKTLTGPSVAKGTRDEIVAMYKDWEEDLVSGAEEITETSKWAISMIMDIPQYNSGRVALLGDAGHAMSTHLAAGAGQAIEDAYMLGHLLTHPLIDATNVHVAFEVYDTIRRPIANQCVKDSLRLRCMYELDPEWVPEGCDVTKAEAGDLDELKKIGKKTNEIYDFHWKTMPQQDWEKARELLERRLPASGSTPNGLRN